MSISKRQRKDSLQTLHCDPIQAAADYGIDISMLKDNLERTPAGRIKRLQIALDTIQKLRKAKPVER